MHKIEKVISIVSSLQIFGVLHENVSESFNLESEKSFRFLGALTYLKNLPGRAERQDGDSNEKVGDRQTDYEHVSDVSELGGVVNREDDENVAKYHHYVDDSEYDEGCNDTSPWPLDILVQSGTSGNVKVPHRRFQRLRTLFSPAHITPGLTAPSRDVASYSIIFLFPFFFTFSFFRSVASCAFYGFHGEWKIASTFIQSYRNPQISCVQ